MTTPLRNPLQALSIMAAVLLTAPVYGNAQCEYAELRRSIEVVYEAPSEPVPCAVRYVKHDEGVESMPWRASNEAGYCEAKAEALRQTLIDLGWRCSDASASPAD